MMVRPFPLRLPLKSTHSTTSAREIPALRLGLTPRQRLAKRIVDLSLSALILIVILPFLLLIAFMIALETPGPIFFKQRRVGEGGRLFWIYKFRTMPADERFARTQEATVEATPRMMQRMGLTQIGIFLRETNLDELPQFLNVLKGDMSLVGPRPELPWIVDQYQDWQRKRFTVPQGITGIWQVGNRLQRPAYRSTSDDLYYIDNYSLWLDLKILAKTLPSLFRR
jgi:lipopolysaccharide/colanic/teichoic acid biosynthesis glycosyltransferase